jgi:hypothetical protein
MSNTAGVQALYESNGRAWAIAAGIFYELAANGTATNIGTVGMGAAAMCASEGQLLIVVQGSGFLFDLTLNTLSPIAAAGWIQGAAFPCFIDGYFICLEPASQEFFISSLNDGTQWSALDFGDAEGAAGNVVGMIADHRQLWLLATDHAEVYYDSGNANFPFTRLEGAFMQQGCAVGATAAKVDNTIMWLGSDEKGDRIVWRAAGYTPQRVSNHSVETFLQSYPVISDATAYSYQEGGHTFYRIDFPSAPSISGAAGLGATWVYDVAAGMWHERAFWNQGVYQADLARTHCFAFGKHLVGDYRSPIVYEQSMNYSTDAGPFIRRVRSAPDLSNGGKFTFYSELRLLVQSGVGLSEPPGPGYDPQIILKSSNDGGFTWGNERPVSMGKLGEYSKLVRWRRLGRSNNRAFQVICSEPVFVALIEADLDAS